MESRSNYYFVSEIFESVQGEGKNAGYPSVFIRLAGCNLSCPWCDSKYARHANSEQKMALQEIIDRVATYRPRHVVITGGEPLLQDIYPLVMALHPDYSIEVETNGTVYDDRMHGLCQFTVSPKLPEIREDILSKWNKRCSYKFVVQSKQDFDRAMHLCQTLNLQDIYVMPEGVEWYAVLSLYLQLVDWVLASNWQVHIVPRLHILKWGNQRGK